MGTVAGPGNQPMLQPGGGTSSSSSSKKTTTQGEDNREVFEQILSQYELKKGDAYKLPRNPLDPISFHRLEAQRRAYYLRRMYVSGAGLLFCVGCTLAIVGVVDIEKMTEQNDALSDSDPLNKIEPGTPVVKGVTGGAEIRKKGDGVKGDAHAGEEKQAVDEVPTGTSTVPTFPRTLTLTDEDGSSNVPVSRREYQLTGLGIRTVSFLGIQVYVVGLYIATEDIPTLQQALVQKVVGPNVAASALIPTEQARLRAMLLDPVEGDKLWSDVLRENRIRTVFRVVPTRTTDFQHLRDGWLRAITARTQKADLARRRGEDVSESFDDDGFMKAVQDFKGIFGGGRKGPKGVPLLMIRDREGVLHVRYPTTTTTNSAATAAPTAPTSSGHSGINVQNDVQSLPAPTTTIATATRTPTPAVATTASSADTDIGSEIGRVQDERISRLIWLNYLAGDKVASEGARKSVVEGVMEMVERPVGTVTTIEAAPVSV